MDMITAVPKRKIDAARTKLADARTGYNTVKTKFTHACLADEVNGARKVKERLILTTSMGKDSPQLTAKARELNSAEKEYDKHRKAAIATADSCIKTLDDAERVISRPLSKGTATGAVLAGGAGALLSAAYLLATGALAAPGVPAILTAVGITAGLAIIGGLAGWAIAAARRSRSFARVNEDHQEKANSIHAQFAYEVVGLAKKAGQIVTECERLLS